MIISPLKFDYIKKYMSLRFLFNNIIQEESNWFKQLKQDPCKLCNNCTL